MVQFRRRRTTRSRSGTSSRRAPSRSPARRNTRARRAPSAKAQTIKIVIEQPQPQIGMPSILPEQVGNRVATTPRRNRF